MDVETEIKILLIEDSEDDYILTREILEEITTTFPAKTSARYVLDWRRSIADANEARKDTSWDVILLDLGLPDGSGLECLDKVKEIFPSVPVLVLTGNADYQIGRTAVQKGAQDFLVKGEFSPQVLERSISYAIDRQKILDQLAQAIRHKSQFLANMSHEIRTPMTAVLGFAEVLIDDNASEREKQKAARTIFRNSQYLTAILSDVLDVSRMEAGELNLELVPVSVSSLINEIYEIMERGARGKGLYLEVITSDAIPEKILGDHVRLKQILLNLIGNAVKFTLKGGIRLGVEYCKTERLLTFTISDTGIGMSGEQLCHLFKPFAQGDSSITRRFGGTGLGLAITKHLVTLLGGTIEVESKERCGTTFTVCLPVRAEREFMERIPSPSHHCLEQPLFGKVLLVEDGLDNQELVRYFLRAAGVEHTIVNDGRAGIAAALSDTFDLVLMDLQMPIVDGISATKALRQAGYTTPIIALTANVESSREECLAAGFSGHLRKPFRREELLSLLANHLRGDTVGRHFAATEEIQDDPEFGHIVKGFIERLPSRVKTIQECMKYKDYRGIAEHAHKLAGAEMFGFPALTRLVRALELSAQREESELVSTWVEALDFSVSTIQGGYGLN